MILSTRFNLKKGCAALHRRGAACFIGFISIKNRNADHRLNAGFHCFISLFYQIFTQCKGCTNYSKYHC